MKRTTILAAVAVSALALGACGGDDDGGSSDGGITVDGAWARPSPAMASAGAAYMTITADEADALLSASVPEDVAAVTEIHETVMVEDEGMDEGMSEDSMADDMGDMSEDSMADDMGDMESDTTMAGMGEMTMRPIERLDLPAGTAVSLEPGGYHIMMLELAAPLEVGSEIEVTLEFENAGTRTVTVPVRDEAP